MLKIENTETYGWEAAIRGMRNPMNSWDKIDTDFGKYYSNFLKQVIVPIGENDCSLMMKLRKAGTDHRKFMRMIVVSFDVTAPLYWWKEFDTYKVGTVANSCSTMHKIHEKEFALDDFSHDHMTNGTLDVMNTIIDQLNFCRKWFLSDGHKDWWWQMIQLLPSSYNQRRTVMLNYEVLANMYKSRKNHKLDEWHTFCEWIETLPYSELITVGEDDASV
jgi:hypothetical protein